MSRHALHLLVLPLALGCAAVAELTFPDCTEEAIQTADGDPDPCDLQACEAAFGEGCTSCAVNQSYPPQYVADDGTTYDLYAFCPDWQPPTTD